MEDFSINNCSGGLELLTNVSLKEPEPQDWLNLETELRKLLFAISRKDRISLVFSKKKIQNYCKSISWPSNFLNLLKELRDSFSDKSTSISLASKILKIIWKDYFQYLPFPGYWDYEELIKRLECSLAFVREKTFKNKFQKILNLVDNYQWRSDLRHELEDLLEIANPNDLHQKIVKIIKKLKKSQPIPVF